MELSHEVQKLTPLIRLGRRLRRLREARGLSIRQLCEQEGLGPLSHSYIGRVELGQQLPSEDLVKSLDRFFGTDGVLFELWELASDDVIPDFARKVVSKEREATLIRVVNSSLIPALLQTREYTTAVFRRVLPHESEERRDELVASRVRRQKIFDRQDPPAYWAITDEAALKRPIGGARHMTEQLRHLSRIVKHPRITLQILPFSVGAHPLLGGSLTLHSLKNGGMIAGVEGFDSGEWTESPKRIADLTQRFDLACSLALTDDQSLEMIQEYLKEYTDEHDS